VTSVDGTLGHHINLIQAIMDHKSTSGESDDCHLYTPNWVNSEKELTGITTYYATHGYS